MKLLKLAFISFIIFFLLITGISLFIPSHIRISKAVQMNVPKEKVLDELKNPANWKHWYPGADSAQLIVEQGVVKGISRNNSQQALVITSVSDTAVIAEHTGLTNRKMVSGWNIMNAENPSTVTVQWYMDFKLKWYPWEKFASLLFEHQYGSQMELGLRTMKKYVEN